MGLNNRITEPARLNRLLQHEELSQSILIFLIDRPAWIDTDILARLLENSHPELRARALLVAGYKGDTRLFAPIEKLLSDTSLFDPERVQGHNRHYYPLQGKEAKQVSIQELAFDVLRLIDTRRAFALLSKLLPKSEDKFRLYILDQLIWAESYSIRADVPDVTLEVLSPFLEHPEPAVRVRALRFLQLQKRVGREPESEPSLPPETWFEFLRDSDASTRRLALTGLAAYEHTPVEVGPVESLCEDSEEVVRSLARKVIEIQKNRKALPPIQQPLDEILKKPYLIGVYQRKGLPDGLSWEDIYSSLLKYLMDASTEDPYKDYLLIDWFVLIRGHNSLPDMFRLLERRAVDYRAFTKIAIIEDIPSFVSLVKNARSVRELVVGIRVLTHLKAKDYSELILTHQSHSYPEVQEAAIEYLGSLGETDQRLHLLTLLKDEKAREQAYRSLKHRPIPDAFGEIIEMAKQGNPELRKVAIRLAGHWKIREAVPVLVEVLHERIPSGPSLPYYSAETEVWFCLRSLPYSSAEALGRIGDPAAIPSLKQGLAKDFGFIAAEALYRLGDYESARAYLLNYLKMGTSDNRIDALDLIQELKDPFYIPYVMTLLPSQESGTLMRHGVRRADHCVVGDVARSILYQTAGNEQIPTLIKMLPEMPSDRIEDIEEILEGIQERAHGLSSEIMHQVRQLMEHPDALIAKFAKQFLERWQNLSS